VALVVSLAAGALETDNPLPEIGIKKFSIDVRPDLRLFSVSRTQQQYKGQADLYQAC
jgi:hypothetical protein